MILILALSWYFYYVVLVRCLALHWNSACCCPPKQHHLGSWSSSCKGNNTICRYASCVYGHMFFSFKNKRPNLPMKSTCLLYWPLQRESRSQMMPPAKYLHPKRNTLCNDKFGSRRISYLPTPLFSKLLCLFWVSFWKSFGNSPSFSCKSLIRLFHVCENCFFTVFLPS